MLEVLLPPLAHLTTGLVSSLGYFGVFITMTIESAGIPLPSEVVMTFSGYLVYQDHFSFWLVVIWGAAGNLAGSLLAYGIGYWAEEAGIRKVVKYWGRFVLLNVSDYDNAEKWFRNWGLPVVFVSRILPVVRTYISFPAGVYRVNLWKFSTLTLLGSLIWAIILTEIGLKLGQNWNSLANTFRKFDIVIVVLLVAVVIYYFYHKISKLKKV